MSDELMLGLLWLLFLLAACGIHGLLFDKKEDYEWRKNMAARRRWKEMMEDEK